MVILLDDIVCWVMMMLCTSDVAVSDNATIEARLVRRYGSFRCPSSLHEFSMPYYPISSPYSIVALSPSCFLPPCFPST